MKSILLLFATFLSLQATGQEVHYRYKEIADQTALDLSAKLDLNKGEQSDLSKVYYESMIALSKNINRIDKLETAIIETTQKRNAEIKNLIGEPRYKLFMILQETEMTRLYDSYVSEFQNLRVNDDFLNEIIEYRFKRVLPVLSQFHIEFTNQMTLSDYYNYKNLRAKYYMYSESLSKGTIGEDMHYRSQLSGAEAESLDYLIGKYVSEIDDIMLRISKFRSIWQKEQKIIGEKYETENAQRSTEQRSKVQAVYKMENALFKLHFLMLMPNDRDKYMSNLNMIYNEEAHFLKTLSQLQ